MTAEGAVAGEVMTAGVVVVVVAEDVDEVDLECRSRLMTRHSRRWAEAVELYA